MLKLNLVQYAKTDDLSASLVRRPLALGPGLEGSAQAFRSSSRAWTTGFKSARLGSGSALEGGLKA